MGEAEFRPDKQLLIIHSIIHFYGDAAGKALGIQVAEDIANHWNQANASVYISKIYCRVNFNITGIYNSRLSPATVMRNTNPRNNYFRVEEFASGDISFVDGLGSNTGYFKLANLLNNSTTAAHEYGHTLGLEHPQNLDLRGRGQPGIMYPRGTLVDPEFQYDPTVRAGVKGGTINPFTRKVYPSDINDLGLEKLEFSREGFAGVGNFTNVWHDRQTP
ncbi:MAG: peptidase M10 [Ginsengibacter sp.]